MRSSSAIRASKGSKSSSAMIASSESARDPPGQQLWKSAWHHRLASRLRGAQVASRLLLPDNMLTLRWAYAWLLLVTLRPRYHALRSGNENSYSEVPWKCSLTFCATRMVMLEHGMPIALFVMLRSAMGNVGAYARVAAHHHICNLHKALNVLKSLPSKLFSAVQGISQGSGLDLDPVVNQTQSLPGTDLRFILRPVPKDLT